MYDSYVGVAEVDAEVEDHRGLVFKYSAPLLVSQPCNIIVLDFTSYSDIDDMVAKFEKMLTEEKAAYDLKEQNRLKKLDKHNLKIFWIVVVPIIILLLWRCV